MTLLANLPLFLLYYGSSLLLITFSMWIYLRITPYNEIQLIRDGNTAAALSLTGTLLGMSIAMASVIIYSTSWTDKVVWCGVALVMQLLMWELVNWVFGNLQRGIAVDRCMADAVVLAGTSVAAGVLQAACFTP
jgi:putative membrane protein